MIKNDTSLFKPTKQSKYRKPLLFFIRLAFYNRFAPQTPNPSTPQHIEQVVEEKGPTGNTYLPLTVFHLKINDKTVLFH